MTEQEYVDRVTKEIAILRIKLKEIRKNPKRYPYDDPDYLEQQIDDLEDDLKNI